MLDILLFVPHGHCYLWQPNLVSLHLVSDALIGIAYYSIPCTVFYFVWKRKHVPFAPISLLFVTFILFFGTNHLMAIWTLWHPNYWLSGTLKAITAGISIYTAIQLIPVVPKAFDLPSPAQLEAINHQLQQQITERKQAEEHLEKTEQRLQQLNQALEEKVSERTAALQEREAQLKASNQELEAFAYSVSHDLRAPLRAIDIYSRALLEEHGAALNKESKGYFARIHSNVVQMGLLIDDLIKLSQASRAEICCGTVNLSALTRELMYELQVLEPERQVKVTIASGAIVSADATLMRIVLMNLLHNAWKFTNHHPTAHIEFGVMLSEVRPIYFVRDDGAGFNMAYSKRLFGVFQRLHSAGEFPGTGIGLATVQRAIHRHGGEVWAEGAVEQGATIYFTVPDPHCQKGA